MDLNEFLDSEINSHIKTKTRVFQALRIEVNGELDTLKRSLSQAIELLESGGNIFVISFHSLEDRIAKQLFKRETRDCICSDIICQCGHTKSLRLMNKKPILPSEQEQKINSRSRSAKARHAQKIL
jgi:16S rRNA (cytosine1402-N4)-methyltransferase